MQAHSAVRICYWDKNVVVLWRFHKVETWHRVDHPYLQPWHFFSYGHKQGMITDFVPSWATKYRLS